MIIFEMGRVYRQYRSQFAVWHLQMTLQSKTRVRWLCGTTWRRSFFVKISDRLYNTAFKGKGPKFAQPKKFLRKTRLKFYMDARQLLIPPNWDMQLLQDWILWMQRKANPRPPPWPVLLSSTVPCDVTCDYLLLRAPFNLRSKMWPNVWSVCPQLF